MKNKKNWIKLGMLAMLLGTGLGYATLTGNTINLETGIGGKIDATNQKNLIGFAMEGTATTQSAEITNEDGTKTYDTVEVTNPYDISKVNVFSSDVIYQAASINISFEPSETEELQSRTYRVPIVNLSSYEAKTLLSGGFETNGTATKSLCESYYQATMSIERINENGEYRLNAETTILKPSTTVAKAFENKNVFYATITIKENKKLDRNIGIADEDKTITTPNDIADTCKLKVSITPTLENN